MDQVMSDRVGGLSYRPLSRPTSNHSSTDASAFQGRHGAPSRRSNFERARSDDTRPVAQISSLTSFNQFPAHRLPHPQQSSRYPAPATASAHSGSTYTPLPPGAYVNPAFFNRVNQRTLSSPPDLPQNVQQQMDILNYFRQFSNK
jgi:hypothetical protein